MNAFILQVLQSRREFLKIILVLPAPLVMQ